MGRLADRRRVQVVVRPRLTEVVSIRFSTPELDRIEAAADQVGMTIAQYIKQAALKQAATRPTAGDP